MAGNGDIGDVTRLVDTITGAAGAQEASKFTTPWTAVAPTLTTGSHATPPEQGGLESDGGSGTNPDLYVGSFALASATPTLGVGSVAGPVGKGDVGDVFGAPDLAGEAQVAGLAAFTNGSPTLGLGTVAAPPEHGDIGDTGGPTTLQGDVNDSSQGMSTLTSWSSGTATLSLGSIPQTGSHGDIGEMVGQGEGPIGQVVWSVVPVTLATGAVATVQGSGDITDPYAWQDTILYLTSQPYPIIYIEQLGLSAQLIGGMFYVGSYIYSENIGMNAMLTGGTLTPALLTYTNWPAEKLQMSATFSGGTLTLALITYTNWPAENMQMSAVLSGGTLTFSLITYTNWPTEKMQMSAALTGGSLS